MKRHVQEEWDLVERDTPGLKEMSPEDKQYVADTFFMGASFVASTMWEMAHNNQTKDAADWLKEVRQELIEFFIQNADRIGMADQVAEFMKGK